jgi:hypothetical protein
MAHQQEGETMTDYLDRFAERVRTATGAAVNRVLTDTHPDAPLGDVIGAALHAGSAAAADVWMDAMLYGDHPPRTPAPPSRAGAIPVAGGLLVNPADYRSPR